MHILVIGGTGFIGYHIVSTLLANNHTVTLLCRQPEKAKSVFGERVLYFKGDINRFASIDAERLFQDIDTFIFAAGVDERVEPTGDPYTFFYQNNVVTCKTLLAQAKACGVRHAIVLGSVFSHIHSLYPKLELYKYHAYIRSRVDQKTECLALASDDFIVNVIEIPFVFGYTPGQGSLWTKLVSYIRIMNPLIVTPGGANAISVNSLGKAIAGVAEHINTSGGIPVGDENLTWVQMLDRISSIVNKKKKHITLLQHSLFTDLTRMGAFFQELIGKKSGLDHNHISKMITLNAFFDTATIKQQLHYDGGDLDQAFADTVKACGENKLIDNLQRSIEWISDSKGQGKR